MKWVTLSCILGVIAASVWFVQNSRAATESPEYEVVKKDGKFEIRDYPEMMIASATAKGGKEDGHFMTLFRFIDGGNEAEQKIAMTTPVLMERGQETGRMSFIVPNQVAKNGTPKPNAKNVSIRTLEKARYAVVRFPRKGSQTEDEKAAIERLQAWMKEQNLKGTSEPIIAYYDPPWTPFFMRRNEVMVKMGNQ